ncbi:MAG: hypothetical protein ACO1RX_14435 [Candidatus Sericytochromatia bacterium]
MKTIIQINYDDNLIFETHIEAFHARVISLLAQQIGTYVAERPQDESAYIARLVQAIEDSLISLPKALSAWRNLCEHSDFKPINVSILGMSGESGASAIDIFSGGSGGSGAWPGGGGGGGGAGLFARNGAKGGEGSDGAILVFEYDHNDSLVDIQVFVTPGTFTWARPIWLGGLKVICMGAGGNGGNAFLPKSRLHNRLKKPKMRMRTI